eukprot:NODE_140_length_17926_cov_0.139620.p13 type:complete len:146 gc:universal NODE_140_length_17926_cov_0.139620:11442-11879(+)
MSSLASAVSSPTPSGNTAQFAPIATTSDNNTVSTNGQPPLNPNQNVTPPNQQNVGVSNNLPILTESPKGSGLEVKPINQVTLDPSKTVDYFVSYALTQTVIDDKTTMVYKSQTFAAIRPLTPKSESIYMLPNLFASFLLLLLIFQ